MVLPDRELELLKLSVRNLSAKADIDTALSVQVLAIGFFFFCLSVLRFSVCSYAHLSVFCLFSVNLSAINTKVVVSCLCRLILVPFLLSDHVAKPCPQIFFQTGSTTEI